MYYYHFDGLGSVVALSDSDGDTVHVYEYSVFGQVAASDPNHANPFLFTGRRFDSETGLYYYRARYYNPHIGRFLQTDPIGYDGGINLYAYCSNSPVTSSDPTGTSRIEFRRYYPPEYRPEDDCYVMDVWMINDDGTEERICGGMPVVDFVHMAANGEFSYCISEEWEQAQAAWELSRGDRLVFWGFQAIIALNGALKYMISELEALGEKNETKMPMIIVETGLHGEYDPNWNRAIWDDRGFGVTFPSEGYQWLRSNPIAQLAHELAYDDKVLRGDADRFTEHGGYYGLAAAEIWAMQAENSIRAARFAVDPFCKNLYPRPGYENHCKDLGSTAAEAWRNCDGRPRYTMPDGTEIYWKGAPC